MEDEFGRENWETPISKQQFHHYSLLSFSYVLKVSIYNDETSKSVSILLTIVNLEKTKSTFCGIGGKNEPSNANVKYNITNQSIDFKCILNGGTKNARYYRWAVKKLPSKIRGDKTKVEVIVLKFKFLFLI